MIQLSPKTGPQKCQWCHEANHGDHPECTKEFHTTLLWAPSLHAKMNSKVSIVGNESDGFAAVINDRHKSVKSQPIESQPAKIEELPPVPIMAVVAKTTDFLCMTIVAVAFAVWVIAMFS